MKRMDFEGSARGRDDQDSHQGRGMGATGDGGGAPASGGLPVVPQRPAAPPPVGKDKTV